MTQENSPNNHTPNSTGRGITGRSDAFDLWLPPPLPRLKRSAAVTPQARRTHASTLLPFPTPRAAIAPRDHTSCPRPHRTIHHIRHDPRQRINSMQCKAIGVPDVVPSLADVTIGPSESYSPATVGRRYRVRPGSNFVYDPITSHNHTSKVPHLPACLPGLPFRAVQVGPASSSGRRASVGKER